MYHSKVVSVVVSMVTIGDYPPADAVHLHNWVIRNAVVVYRQEVHTAVF